SHTFFVPPARDFRHNYGFRMQFIGGECLVTAVPPGSPAESAGLQAGDKILRIGNITPKRRAYIQLGYLLNILRTLPGLHLEIAKPNGDLKTYEFAAMMRQEKQVIGGIDFMDEVRYAQRSAAMYDRTAKHISDDVLVWKLPAFNTNEKG